MDVKQPLGQSTDKTAGRKQKKPFEPPRLHVYGDISTLTRMIGQTGSPTAEQDKQQDQTVGRRSDSTSTGCQAVE
jgi:hypothetical protein